MRNLLFLAILLFSSLSFAQEAIISQDGIILRTPREKFQFFIESKEDGKTLKKTNKTLLKKLRANKMAKYLGDHPGQHGAIISLTQFVQNDKKLNDKLDQIVALTQPYQINFNISVDRNNKQALEIEVIEPQICEMINDFTLKNEKVGLSTQEQFKELRKQAHLAYIKLLEDVDACLTKHEEARKIEEEKRTNKNL